MKNVIWKAVFAHKASLKYEIEIQKFSFRSHIGKIELFPGGKFSFYGIFGQIAYFLSKVLIFPGFYRIDPDLTFWYDVGNPFRREVTL